MPRPSSPKVLKNVASGANPTQIQKGINLAVEAIIGELAKMSKKIENSKEVAQVGTSSANQDEQIGKMIADAMDKVGKDGVITVEEGKIPRHPRRTRRRYAVRQGIPQPAFHHRHHHPGSGAG